MRQSGYSLSRALSYCSAHLGTAPLPTLETPVMPDSTAPRAGAGRRREDRDALAQGAISPGYDGAAVVALALGLAATLFWSVPAAGGALGLAACCAALASRARLRRDPALRGSGLSLLAMLLGGAVVLTLALRFAVPWIVQVAASLS